MEKKGNKNRNLAADYPGVRSQNSGARMKSIPANGAKKFDRQAPFMLKIYDSEVLIGE